MTYEYVPNDPNRYATNLRRDNGSRNLMWDNARGQDVLIVQTPFGQRAGERMPEVCRAMGSVTVPPNKYVEVVTGVWVRFVTAADKVRNNGCPVNEEASTYTVFSCHVDGDVCRICQPGEGGMISPYCDIPMELHVSVARSTRVEGMFRKREVETGFYRITFPANFGRGYMDGDLRYKVGDLVIPVTRQMLEQRDVYVRTESKPSLISANKGLRLV